MDTFDTMVRLRQHLTFGRSTKPDYKSKLQRPQTTSATTILPLPSPYAEQIRALTRHPDATSVAFQSVLGAAYRTVAGLYRTEQQVASAALSLAQQEKLTQMVAELDEVVGVLRAGLTKKMTGVLRTSSTAPESGAERERSWWFALVEATEVANEAMTCLKSLVAGQPQGGPTRTLGQILVRLLQGHHAALLAEAEQWMD